MLFSSIELAVYYAQPFLQPIFELDSLLFLSTIRASAKPMIKDKTIQAGNSGIVVDGSILNEDEKVGLA